METKDSQPAESPAEATEPNESSGQRRPIVAGIGASAGGIQALQAFFEALPEKLGVAFVVVVHLSPEHRSHLGEILAACTPIPIQQVQGAVPLEGDHIYLIPPNRRLQISDNMVAALPFEEPRGRRENGA